MAMGKCRECGKEVSSEAKACPHCGVSKPIKPAISGGMGCLIMIGLLVFVGSIINSNSPNRPSSAAPSEETLQLQLNRINLKYEWQKGGFDNVMIINFTVQNRNQFPIKDFTISCDHSAPSGTRIDSNRKTVYEVVPANGKLSKKEFNMGFIASQAARSSCSVTGFVRG